MSDKNKNINYLFTILFIISIIYTTLRLFSLQDDLILSSTVLDSSQASLLSPVLFQLYIAVGTVILSGIIVLILGFKSNHLLNENHIADNSSKNVNKAEGRETETEAETDIEKSTTDTEFIKVALKDTKDKKDKFSITLTAICKKLEIGQGAVYVPKEIKGIRFVEFYVGYAFSIAESETIKFEYGEGLIGQVAKEGDTLIIDEIPENYINIISGLGKASPKHLLIMPLYKGKMIEAVIELASFTEFSKESVNLIKESFNLLVVSPSGEGKKTKATSQTKKDQEKAKELGEIKNKK
ncbi:MAG: GAF domain-containing protein [Cyclobacteriaceae bacterium]|nr:GAF domain-containing protein [Cyclobacteriaceae bacterium]